MKNIYFALLFAILVLPANSFAQSACKVAPLLKNEGITDGKILYALPKTVIKVDVILQKLEKEKGPYAEFASKLLGINNIVSNKQTVYSIVDANISTYAEVDSEQYYLVDTKNSAVSINILPNGIIQSINEEVVYSKPNNEEYAVNKNNTVVNDFIISYPREEAPSKVPFEELSLRKQAEETADQINKIRQKKLDLLSGDYDDQYSSFAIEFMYKKLDSLENYYLQFFTGKLHSSYITETFTFCPEKRNLSENEIVANLFRFSETEGILPFSSTGIPCQMRIKCKNNLALVNDGSKLAEGFFYRISEEAVVNLTLGPVQKNRTLLIPQFGKVMNLPKTSYKAKFDTETGNILEYKATK